MTITTESLQEAALKYAAMDRSVFPVTPGQKTPPLVKWRAESTKDPEQVKALWSNRSDANIGLDCGKSGIVVIDADTRDCGIQHWADLCEEHNINQDTLTVRTPSGGLHIYYITPDRPIGNSSALSRLGIDVRGNGGYSLLPPSGLEEGGSYRVEKDAEIIPMPQPLIDILITKDDLSNDVDDNSQIIPEGRRDSTLTSLAGTMRRRGMSPEAIESALLADNELRCRPPLAESQVKKIARSIGAKPPGKSMADKDDRNRNGSDVQNAKLVNLASSIPLFHDEYQEPFAFIDGQTVPLKSKKAKSWLSGKFYLAERKAPGTEALNQAILVLEAKAIFEGKEIPLHNRIASCEGAFWYDLGNAKAIKIIPGNWEIVDAPILFRRYSHQKSQAIPVSGGDPFDIFNFLNVKEDQKLLVLVCMVSYFIPDIPHPIFHPLGPHGSGKSSACIAIKRLCDPSRIEMIVSPRKQSELVQVLSHHHVSLFDNMSNLPDWMSDILCQACTGGGFSKRQLYTDDDDIIYVIKRCVGLNGINLLTVKADVMDRSILLPLERIEGDRRMDEAELWAAFEEARPRILGGIFDALAKSMALYRSVRLPYLPRMADFAKWGYVIAESLGFSGDEFLRAYQANVCRQNEEVVQSNALAQAVITLMSDRESWDGTIRQAFDRLREIINPDKKDSTFPKSYGTLRKHLERIKPNLADYGISYAVGKRASNGYPISFRKDENFRSFGSFDTQPLQDNELADEPKVNQDEANGRALSLDTPSNPLIDNAHEPNEANEAELQALREHPSSSPGRFHDFTPEIREELEERAAKFEFDAGMSRAEAELAVLILAGEPT